MDLEGVQTKPEVVRVIPEQGRRIALAVVVAITGGGLPGYAVAMPGKYR